MKKEQLQKIKRWEKELSDKKRKELDQEYYDTLELEMAKPFRHPIDWILAIIATTIIIGVILIYQV